MKIYLAGDMHGNWQDDLINKYPGVIFIDPRLHGFTDPQDYTRWDLGAILESDAVIAYISENNPSGIGTVLEIGFALGKEIPVLLVCEKEDRYFDIVEHAATLTFSAMVDLIDFLTIMGGLNSDTVYAMRFRGSSKLKDLFTFYKNKMTIQGVNNENLYRRIN